MRQIGIMMAVSRNMKSGVDKTNVRTHEQKGTQTLKKYRGKSRASWRIRDCHRELESNLENQ